MEPLRFCIIAGPVPAKRQRPSKLKLSEPYFAQYDRILKRRKSTAHCHHTHGEARQRPESGSPDLPGRPVANVSLCHHCPRATWHSVREPVSASKAQGLKSMTEGLRGTRASESRLLLGQKLPQKGTVTPEPLCPRAASVTEHKSEC